LRYYLRGYNLIKEDRWNQLKRKARRALSSNKRAKLRVKSQRKKAKRKRSKALIPQAMQRPSPMRLNKHQQNLMIRPASILLKEKKKKRKPKRRKRMKM